MHYYYDVNMDTINPMAKARELLALSRQARLYAQKYGRPATSARKYMLLAADFRRLAQARQAQIQSQS